MLFDLLIKGAHVIDPGVSMSRHADVALAGGRISAVADQIPASSAFRVVDAAGLYLAPGFIDLHTHVFHGATYWGVRPDPVAARSGVTTWVDAGSAGAFNVEAFRNYVVRASDVRIMAFINVSSVGLTAHDYELSNLALCDARLFEEALRANGDFVVGGKVRLGSPTVGSNGFEPLRRASAVLNSCGLPLMLHIAEPPPHPNEFASLLRPGDVVTHCFTRLGMSLVDRYGALRPFAREWLERGVNLDVGHGSASFSFAVAEALLEHGVRPDFISSDLHVSSIDGPAYDLPTCMNKMLALGMSLEETVQCVTMNPARFLKLPGEIGTLAVGGRADMVLFRFERDSVLFYDSAGEQRASDRQIVPVGTFISGRRMRVEGESSNSLHKW